MWIYQKIYTFVKLSLCFYVSLFVLLCITDSPVVAESDKKEQHITIILVPGLSFEEMEWLYHHASDNHLWTTGAYAAINLRSDGNYSYLNNAVSLSVGRRAVGVKDWNSFERDELVDGTKAVDLMRQWYGDDGSADLVHPYLHLLEEKMAANSYGAHIGWLGESLNEQNVFTYVIGNADTREDKERYASLFVMNKSGEANGNLYDVIVDNRDAPLGVEIDKTLVVEKLIDVQKQHERTFTVVEWGDLYRLFSEEGKIEPEHFDYLYENTLLRLEETVAMVQHLNTEVWLLSPAVNNNAYARKNQLGPLWIWKNDSNTSKATLYSETTRRTSLVSNTDIAETWVQAYIDDSLHSGSSLGNALLYKPVVEENDWSFIDFQKRLNEINYVYAKRGAVLSSYVTGLVLLLIVVSLMIWLLKDVEKWKKAAVLLLLSGVSSPFIFIIIPPVMTNSSPYLYVMLVTFLSFLLGLLITKLSKKPFSVACGLFFITLMFDVILGGYLLERSFLSYDPVIGARYYGIGNEFAGIFIVSGLLMIVPFIGKFKDHLSFKAAFTIWFKLMSVLVILLIALGSSTYGANAGASLAVSVVMFFLTIQLLLKNITWPVKLVTGFLFLFVVLVGIYALQLKAPSTHIYIAFQQLLSGDTSAIWQTIIRKVEMNIKIFRVSYWTQLFITSYFLVGLIVWRRKKQELHKQQTFMMNTCIVASLALLVLNDSGIVAAATSMFITISVCYGWSLQNSVSARANG
ncbi:hypothetical protein [Evansella cellulosilytica]|nr:hypothetical protein [Evansella cellulosilytica]